MNHSVHHINQWMHLQTWRFVWLHFFWFIPLTYGVFSYQGPAVPAVRVGYAWLLLMILLYAIWQIRAYLRLPPTLNKILTQLSRPYAQPIYVVFNLTEAPLKLNTHFNSIISEPTYHVRWYQSPDAEFLELSPHALVALNFQKKLCILLLRHIAPLRFGGLVIQIGRSTLLQMPTFKTVSALIGYIDQLKYRTHVPYQIMIYDDQHDQYADAIILRPEPGYQQHPKLWEAMRQSFQELIERIHQHNETTPLQQATLIDFLMPPTQTLLASIGAHPSLICHAIHLIGFNLPNPTASQNPLLKRYTPTPWPRLISRFAVFLILISAGLVVKEHYELQQAIYAKEQNIKTAQHTTLAQQLMQDLLDQDPTWATLLQPLNAPKLDPSWRTETRRAFNALPKEAQVASMYPTLAAPPEWNTPQEVNQYFDHVARFACTLKGEAENPNCLSALMDAFTHHWIRLELQNLEHTLLPIDLSSHMEASVRRNQLNYLLKHPDIIGEHVHQRLSLLEQALKEHPDASLRQSQFELQSLVESFKESASYQALSYLFEQSTQGTPVDRPKLHPINACDRRVMERILPQHINDHQHPAPLAALVPHWDELYRAYLPLKGCFPLHQTSSQDCDPHAFIAFFAPNTGTFDRLWPQFASLLQEHQGNITLSPEWTTFVDPALIDRYMQVRLIQSMFFDHQSPITHLRLRPEITDRALNAQLHIQNHLYPMSSNPHLDIPIHWNPLEPAPIKLSLSVDQQEEVREFSGPWALWRFIDQYLTPPHNALRIQYLNHELRIHLLGHPQLAPWHHHLYDQFDLPEQILITKQPSSIDHFQADSASEGEEGIEGDTLLEAQSPSHTAEEPFELHERILDEESQA